LEQLEPSNDLLKAILLFPAYVIFPVIGGFLIKDWRKGQRILIGIICFMTIGGILSIAEWSLTLHPFLYRSHARGYHFYFIVLPALTLIWSQVFARKDFKLIPPGFWLFYVFCASACVSIINAQWPTYVIMAALKTLQLTTIVIAVYNFIKTDKDLKFVLNCMAWVMVWQFIVVLKMKYIDHIHQVFGTFEHQNALSTFAVMIGLCFLGIGLGPKEDKANWFLLVYIFCAYIVLATLSRGSLATFAMGSALVVGVSLIDNVTKRRLAVLASLCVVGLIGIAFTMDTVMARFNDKYNDESKNTRDMLNKASRMMVHDYPLGVGWNNYGRMLNHPNHYGDHIDDWQRKWGNPVDPSYQKGISESLYYLILAENGYLSLALYVGFLCLFLWYNVYGALTFRTDVLGGFSLGMFAGCIAIYAQSTLERVLTQPRNMSLWFILIAAAAKIEYWRRQENKWRKKKAVESKKKTQREFATA
jgi:hypothetical protein